MTLASIPINPQSRPVTERPESTVDKTGSLIMCTASHIASAGRASATVYVRNVDTAVDGEKGFHVFDNTTKTE